MKPYIHTFIYTYIHTCIHTYILSHIHAYMHTYIHAYIHACIHTYIYTYIHTYIHHAYMHTYIHIPWRVHTHTQTNTHTHTHTHTHMCVCVCAYPTATCALCARGCHAESGHHDAHQYAHQCAIATRSPDAMARKKKTQHAAACPRQRRRVRGVEPGHWRAARANVSESVSVCGKSRGPFFVGRHFLLSRRLERREGGDARAHKPRHARTNQRTRAQTNEPQPEIAHASLSACVLRCMQPATPVTLP